MCGILCAEQHDTLTPYCCRRCSNNMELLFIISCMFFCSALILHWKKKITKRSLKSSRGCKYLALCLKNVASFIAPGYISLETHKLWNVRILCILIECGTVNGCGNSAAWRLIPRSAVSQPSPWASIKWQNGPILENNNNKNTSLYGNNIRSHLESTMVTACKWLHRVSVIRAVTVQPMWHVP